MLSHLVPFYELMYLADKSEVKCHPLEDRKLKPEFYYLICSLFFKKYSQETKPEMQLDD